MHMRKAYQSSLSDEISLLGLSFQILSFQKQDPAGTLRYLIRENKKVIQKAIFCILLHEETTVE